MEKIERVAISCTIRKDILEQADCIVNQSMLPGIGNRSALLEYALSLVIKEVFKEGKHTPEFAITSDSLTAKKTEEA